MSEGQGWGGRAPKSARRPQVRGTDPARPRREERPPGDPRGTRGDWQSRARPGSSSRGPLASRPGPGPHHDPAPTQPRRQHPRPGPPLRAAGPPAPRRPPPSHLLTSPWAGPEQLCQAPASHPPPRALRPGPSRSLGGRQSPERAEGEERSAEEDRPAGRSEGGAG